MAGGAGIGHRPGSQHLLRGCLEVLAVAVGEPSAQAIGDGGVVGEQIGRPGDRGRGRLVASGDQGHQLVAQVDVVERRAVLVPRAHQEREHVFAAFERRVDTGADDMGLEQAADAIDPGVAEAGRAGSTVICESSTAARTGRGC